MVGAARGRAFYGVLSCVRLSALVARRASVLDRVLDGSLLRHSAREAVSWLTSADVPLGLAPSRWLGGFVHWWAIYAAFSAFLQACSPSGMN